MSTNRNRVHTHYLDYDLRYEWLWLVVHYGTQATFYHQHTFIKSCNISQSSFTIEKPTINVAFGNKLRFPTFSTCPSVHTTYSISSVDKPFCSSPENVQISILFRWLIAFVLLSGSSISCTYLHIRKVTKFCCDCQLNVYFLAEASVHLNI